MVVTVYFKEDNSVRSKEQEDRVLDYAYNAPIVYSFTTHQTRDPIPADVSYHASWITAKCSSLGAQYSYQDTSSHLANADIGVTSALGQAPTSQRQMQMQLLRPELPTTLSSQTPLGAKEDFLCIGAQFYGQSEHSQKENATRQQRGLAPCKNGSDTRGFETNEDCDYALLGREESTDSP
jgi:hypothetical protein